ncbi:MAG TPA: glycosyltransferase family 4 protein [Thermoanaerobaculia bacterium]|nr:glycosyltransferase family 4 protein [Thermoanaerobaculia bacterium]
MRLLWLIDSLTVGGAESLIVPFARKQQHELTVACLTTIQGNAIARELEKEGIAVVNLESKNLRDWRAFRRLSRLARERRFELIHAHLTYASIWGALLSRRTGIPCVATLHVAPPARGRDRIKDRLMRFALNRWAARTIAVSAALREKYLAAGGLDPAKLLVAHNGIAIERFAHNGSPAHGRQLMTVSVLRPGKGIEVLIEALTKIPSATLMVVGDGPMREEWAALAQRFGVAGRIQWLGYRNDVETLLPRADLFVLPSLDDAFPTVLLEAMAAGVPVVATRVGGIPEIVDDGVTGKLVPPNDAAALAAAINALLDADTSGMRDAARTRARERFSTEAWIARLDAIYAEVAR